jgi:hypothetical protein
MAAVAATVVDRTIFGNKRILTATFGAIADTNTFATGMQKIEFAAAQITDAAAAADALTITSVASGIVTFGVAGTISGAMLLVIGT